MTIKKADVEKNAEVDHVYMADIEFEKELKELLHI
jgi:hypothetical protein